MASAEKWTTFFLKAGISPDSAALYADTFVENKMDMNLMKYVDKGDLRYA